jgi:hypothetical protein
MKCSKTYSVHLQSQKSCHILVTLYWALCISQDGGNLHIETQNCHCIAGEHGIPGEYNSGAGHQTKSTTPS